MAFMVVGIIRHQKLGRSKVFPQFCFDPVAHTHGQSSFRTENQHSACNPHGDSICSPWYNECARSFPPSLFSSFRLFLESDDAWFHQYSQQLSTSFIVSA
jgi:hypothetical protein